MKKGIFILLVLTFALFLCWPATADQKGRAKDYRQSPRERRSDPGMARGYEKQNRDRDDDYRKPDRRPPGYYSRAHGRPHKEFHRHRGHDYRYDGHWNSWREWDRYRKGHPQRFHDGRYYRENGHLFFRFCDPVGAACFFFSIGR